MGLTQQSHVNVHLTALARDNVQCNLSFQLLQLTSNAALQSPTTKIGLRK